MKVETRVKGKIKQDVFTKASTVIQPNSRKLIAISGPKGKSLDLPKRDMIFEPTNTAVTVFTHPVNGNTVQVLAENPSGLPVFIPKNTRLGHFEDQDIEALTAIPSTEAPLAANVKKQGWTQQALNYPHH